MDKRGIEISLKQIIYLILLAILIAAVVLAFTAIKKAILK